MRQYTLRFGSVTLEHAAANFEFGGASSGTAIEKDVEKKRARAREGRL